MFLRKVSHDLALDGEPGVEVERRIVPASRQAGGDKVVNFALEVL